MPYHINVEEKISNQETKKVSLIVIMGIALIAIISLLMLAGSMHAKPNQPIPQSEQAPPGYCLKYTCHQNRVTDNWDCNCQKQ